MVNPVLQYPILGYHYRYRLRLTRRPKMKLLKGNPDNVVDVHAKLTVGAKRRLWAIALALSLLTTGVLWIGYIQFWKPHQYRQTAEFVMRDALKDSWWLKDPIAGSGQAPLSDMQPIDQSLELANLLATNNKVTIDNERRIELSHKLFQFAISFGNPFARVDYGVALLVGNLGLPDKSAADFQFAQAVRELQESAKMGKPREAIAYSILLSAGYGLPKNISAANGLVEQVLSELSVNDLLRLMVAPGDRDDLNPIILKSLIAKGYSVPEEKIKWVCEKKSIDEKMRVMNGFLNHIKDTLGDQYYSRFTAISKEEEKCVSDLYAQLPIHKSKSTAEASSTTPLKFYPPPEKIQRMEVNKPQVETKSLLKAPVARDAEKQSDTGYLNGSPSPVAAGLSTFTVDNKSGGADAVARIYLNGDKPAIRQIYIKTGEKFTAKDLAPGRYVLRYRFIGGEDTFEADKIFTLQEVSTDEGTRFSNVSVTLFTVANGNMKVKRVPNEKF